MCIIANLDLSIGKAGQHTNGLQVGRPHITGRDDSELLIGLSCKYPECRLKDANAAPFDERAEYIDSVGRDYFFVELRNQRWVLSRPCEKRTQ